jgi:hypothetical protein
MKSPLNARRFMIITPLSSSLRLLAAPGWLLGLALLTGTWAGAQNFVRNPDFNAPLGPDNWTIVYVSPSSEADFYIHDRSTLAHRDRVFGTWDGNYFGLHFRPYTCGLMEAYATQTITNLAPGGTYVASAWMTQFSDKYIPKMNAWLEAAGALGTQASATVTDYAFWPHDGWKKFSVTNRATGAGQMEVRLRFKVVSGTSNGGTTPKWLSEDAFYDHVSLMPLVETPLPQPQILSCVSTCQTAVLKWTTIMNNTYDIEASADLASWSKFKTNLVATGTNLSYTGAVTANPALPQFFRIVSHNYVP